MNAKKKSKHHVDKDTKIKKLKLVCLLLGSAAIGMGVASAVIVPIMLAINSNVNPPVSDKFLADGTNWNGRQSGTITMSFNEESKTCTITSNTNWVGELNIPKMVIKNSTDSQRYTITAIGGGAFSWCSKLVGSLTIPNTIIHIGDYAFSECYGLNGPLTIGNSVVSIGICAFYNCKNLTGKLLIPNSVHAIGINAFGYCLGLTSFENKSQNFVRANNVGPNCYILLPSSSNGVYAYESDSDQIVGGLAMGQLVIPGSIENIGNRAFQNCSGLTGILTLNHGIKTIGDYAFSGCYYLTGSLTFPDSITSIGIQAFAGCSRFNGALSLGNGIINIGNSAFENCDNFIGSLHIPSSVRTIGYQTFFGCTKLSGALTIENGVKEIDDGAFRNCENLTGDLSIPNTVTSIGSNTFGGCTKLAIDTVGIGDQEILYSKPGNSMNVWCLGITGNPSESVAFPDFKNDMFGIAAGAFSECTNLTGGLTTPNAVTSIGHDTFNDCTGLTSVTFGGPIVSIGDNAFQNCSGMTGGLTIPNSVESIGDSAFSGCTKLDGDLTIGDGVIEIGANAFQNCSGMTGGLTIPNGIISIKHDTFNGCAGLTSITFNDSIVSIGDNAFQNCSGMTGGLTIPASIESIGANAFSGCTELDGDLTINDGIIEIGVNAFMNCENLTGDLLIPNTVTSIGTNAFSGCTELNFDTVTIGDQEILYSKSGNLKNVWCLGATGNPSTSITFPTFKSNTYGIIPGAFSGCTNLIGVLTIPNTITIIGSSAFNDCTGLTSVVFNGAIVSIGNNAFKTCQEINSYTFASNQTFTPTMGYSTFADCAQMGTISGASSAKVLSAILEVMKESSDGSMGDDWTVASD